MAPTPAAVAGTLTYRFGSSIRLSRPRAAVTVPASSFARRGDTSTDTNPSVPSDDSCTGARISSAWRMSSSTSCQ